MKALLLCFVLATSVETLSAQHYGGLYLSANWITHGDGTPFWRGVGKNLQSYDYSFGYSAGYQGLLMENRRISFSYGLQYAFQYMETSYSTDGISIGYPGKTYENVVRSRDELHSLEIPLTWRYNILKNRKLQPYVAFSTTSVIPLQTKRMFTHFDESQEEAPWSWGRGYSLFFDFGVGVNYKVNDWIFNVQTTVRPWNSWGKLGISFSVMKRF